MNSSKLLEAENKMRLFFVFAFCFGLAVSNGSKCRDISGKWQNELGSQMQLKVGANNLISGEYDTAVESTPGAAAFTSNITGVYSHKGDRSLLAFSVLFNHGKSLTSWIGQCTVCDGKEVLHTAYTFRKYKPDFQEKWATVVFNYNTFYRFNEEANIELVNPGTEAYFPVTSHSVVSNTDLGGLDLEGKWKAENGEEFEIYKSNGNVLEGKYHSTTLYGQKDGNSTFTAVALVSTEGKRIKSLTGFIYDTPPTNADVMETAWLEHEFNPSCIATRDDVRIGVLNFTRVAIGKENYKMSETFLDKIRRFFSSMF